MFYSTIALAEKYDYLNERFRRAYEFLRRDDLASLPVGAIELGGSDVIANVQAYTTQPASVGLFETHDRYFDIQYVVSGEEQFGVAMREGLTVSKAYNPDNDITFYEDPAQSGTVLLRAGDLIVVAPEDAHKPRCEASAPCAVQKIVIKILV